MVPVHVKRYMHVFVWAAAFAGLGCFLVYWIALLGGGCPSYCLNDHFYPEHAYLYKQARDADRNTTTYQICGMIGVCEEPHVLTKEVQAGVLAHMSQCQRWDVPYNYDYDPTCLRAYIGAYDFDVEEMMSFINSNELKRRIAEARLTEEAYAEQRRKDIAARSEAAKVTLNEYRICGMIGVCTEPYMKQKRADIVARYGADSKARLDELEAEWKEQSDAANAWLDASEADAMVKLDVSEADWRQTTYDIPCSETVPSPAPEGRMSSPDAC